MSLDKCLPDLERKGEIDVGRSAEARALYAELKAFYERTHDPETAAALASQKTIERLEGALAHKKRNLIRMVRAQQDALSKVRTYDGADPTAGGPLDPRGVSALLGFDGKAGHGDTVEARWKTVKGRAHGLVDEILATHNANIIGNIRRPAELEQLVDEAFKPGSTGNENARELAEAFVGEHGAASYLRSRWNAAGGNMGKIERWFPQNHSTAEIRAAGYEAWRDFVSTGANPTGKPLFDRDRMIDRRTGEPFTDQAWEPFVRDLWETLRTDGWNGIEAGQAGGKMLANQRADARVIHFADGPAWRAYNERFGSSNAFDAMMSHIDGMSRDVALMEILGPNPAATIRWLKDMVVKSARLDSAPGSKAIAKAESAAPKIQALYDEITGSLRRPENEKIALAFQTVRSVQSSAKLGSAIFSALPTDPAFGAVTRAFNGIPMRHMIGSYIRMLSTENEKFAVRAGLIAEEWSHLTSASYRFMTEELTGNVAQRLSNFVLRASGLSWFTQAGRWAYGMDVLGHLTDIHATPFDELDGRLRAAFDRHGISSADWDAIRHAPVEEHKGAGWILPKNIEDQSAGGAADKLLQFIHNEVDFAVPLPDLRTRAFINRHVRRGTIPGELIKSGFLFKGFGIGVLLTHGRRILDAAPATGAGYAAALFALTTLGGALSLELKQVAPGKDPRPIPKPKDGALANAQFWGAAAAQGGGWGIFGDFLNSSTNRFGGGFGSTLAGPQAQTVQNVGLLAGDSARKALGDKKAAPGRDLVTLLKQETPGSSLWFSRLAFERLVADQLQEQIDPHYRQSWRATQRRAKETGQDFWWEPGATAPKRAPDFSHSLGGGKK
jgi:hypothetical protein